MTTVNYRFVVKRDTAAHFTTANTLLLQGEWALETDTGKFKMGDGVTAWNSLAYVTTSHIPEGTNLYFTDERAQDAVAAMIAAGTHSGITFTYDDANNKISATVTSAGSTGGALGCTFDGGGATLVAGTTCDVVIPYNCTINAATLLADQTGSLVVSVWSDTYSNYPPTAADNIAASAPPTLASAISSRDTTLTGWTTTLVKGRTLRFRITSCSAIQRATLTLEVTKT